MHSGFWVKHLSGQLYEQGPDGDSGSEALIRGRVGGGVMVVGNYSRVDAAGSSPAS